MIYVPWKQKPDFLKKIVPNVTKKWKIKKLQKSLGKEENKQLDNIEGITVHPQKYWFIQFTKTLTKKKKKKKGELNSSSRVIKVTLPSCVFSK